MKFSTLFILTCLGAIGVFCGSLHHFRTGIDCSAFIKNDKGVAAYLAYMLFESTSNDNDEALLESVNESALRVLCERYSLTSSGTKRSVLLRLIAYSNSKRAEETPPIFVPPVVTNSVEPVERMGGSPSVVVSSVSLDGLEQKAGSDGDRKNYSLSDGNGVKGMPSFLLDGSGVQRLWRKIIKGMPPRPADTLASGHFGEATSLRRRKADALSPIVKSLRLFWSGADISAAAIQPEASQESDTAFTLDAPIINNEAG